MIGWLLSAGVLALLLSLKAGVWLRWESGTALLKIRIGWLRFTLSAKKKGKADKNPASVQKSTAEKKTEKTTLKKWISALISHWREVLQLLGKILKAPELQLLCLRVVVGGRDPEACALNYGRICAAVSAVLPALQSVFRINQQDIDVSVDFERNKTDLLCEAELTLRIYEILAIVVSGMLLLIKIYRHVKNCEKAVRSR